MNDGQALRNDNYAVYKGKKTRNSAVVIEKKRTKYFPLNSEKKNGLMTVPSYEIKFGPTRKAIQIVMGLM